MQNDDNQTVTEPTYHDRAMAGVAAAVPHLYANGFVVTASTTDLLTTLELNGAPVATVNLSFTAAKSLAISLGGQIAQIEDVMGQEIRSSQDIDAAIARQAAGGSDEI